MSSVAPVSPASSESLSSPAMPSTKPVVVVGAGLAGSMVALLFAQRGLNVLVLERRPDFRTTEFSTSSQFSHAIKRSINLALSYRGIAALKAVGLFDRIMPLLIPMVGRIIHKIADGKHDLHPYGIGDQAIYSISRSLLNKVVVDELDKQSNVTVKFDCKVSRVNKDGVVTYIDTHVDPAAAGGAGGVDQQIEASFVIGADGAYSIVRSSLFRLTRIDYSIEYIKHGYKELVIPPTDDGQWRLSEWQGLHIWPRHDFMLIALPNPDHSFTVTLFAPFEGEHGFDAIQTDEQIQHYFETYFPDVIPLIPNLIQDYKTSPTSALLSIKTNPWHYKGKVVLIGDAAHAVCPFFGQGMNAAFEDGLLLSELFDELNGDAERFLPEFSRRRVEAGHALADLSLANYVEMRSNTANPLFVAWQKFEKLVHSVVGSWYVPQYTMVAFSRTPYHEAVRRAQKQKRVLQSLLFATTATVGILTTFILSKNKLLSSSSSSSSSSSPSSSPETSKVTSAWSTLSESVQSFTNKLPSFPSVSSFSRK